MSTMRSLSFPKINTSHHMHLEDISDMSPSQYSPTHSRDSSSASSTSSPITPTFSTRGHTRWPSSSSSLTTLPDSPATANTPTPLHDLAEEPAERDELLFDDFDEPLCICDTTFCEHRQTPAPSPAAAPLSPPEWTPGDDYFSDGQLPGEPVMKRQRSGTGSSDSLASRLSRHFPSFSKRFPVHRSTASISNTNLRSAPSSRSSSLRLPSTGSIPSVHEMRHVITTPPFSPALPTYDERSASPPRNRETSQTASRAIDIAPINTKQDPVEHRELASTPLLPPMMLHYSNSSSEAVQSPLQSPTVAAHSTAPSGANTPSLTPIVSGFATPPLSAKASTSSLHKGRSVRGHKTSEIPPLTIAEETDHWAIKLGHADFHIIPEPYIPEVCDSPNCRRLQDDWEAARVEYMRQATRISEHYGITSHTYKLTEQKWAEIDAEWRSNHEQANAEAQASGESPLFQPLAEIEAVPSKLPTLNDPKQPSKFPTVDDKDIVGPMVRFAKINHEQRTIRKPSFLKLFTDPASLLGGRQNASVRR